MIGANYTPGLLADLAKEPRVRSMEIPVTPNGQRIASYTRRYTDDWDCKTTSVTAGVDKDSTRFGSVRYWTVKWRRSQCLRAVAGHRRA